MVEQHPFSKFIAILARGKTKTRSFTLAESEEAMGMILRGEVEPEQVGAFLMLMRLKEETPEEIAGFALGARATMNLPDEIPAVDIDWSSYAGKRRQLPWFLLSALLLARNGFKVFMHGTEGHTPGRVYTRECLELLGFPIAASFEEARGHILKNNFAYVPLEVISPRLKDLIGLRPILGLRSPVHSFARMLNPFNAPAMMQGIFHRGFMDVHAGAAQYLGQPAASVFRGEGGEVERRPNKPTEVWTTRGSEGEPLVEFWPRLSKNGHQAADEVMNIADLAAVWRGETQNAYAEDSVTGTMAIALKLMGQADSMERAQALAETMWADRDKNQLPACA
jgi:anthranilate phosphoribosyltransferase